MLTFLALAALVAAAQTLSASTFSALCMLIAGAAFIIVAGRNAADASPLNRICYGAALLCYLAGMPYWTHIITPHYQAAPPPVAWLLPLLYAGLIPLTLLLAPIMLGVGEVRRWRRRRPYRG